MRALNLTAFFNEYWNKIWGGNTLPQCQIVTPVNFHLPEDTKIEKYFPIQSFKLPNKTLHIWMGLSEERLILFSSDGKDFVEKKNKIICYYLWILSNRKDSIREWVHHSMLMQQSLLSDPAIIIQTEVRTLLMQKIALPKPRTSRRKRIQEHAH